jgi:hypothetical protein
MVLEVLAILDKLWTSVDNILDCLQIPQRGHTGDIL